VASGFSPSAFDPNAFDPDAFDFGDVPSPTGGVPAGGYFDIAAPSGELSIVFIRPGERTVTTLNVAGREETFDQLAGSAFQVTPTFLDISGNPYEPSTVHVKVVLRPSGTQIIALTEVSGWTQGDPITIPGTWTALQSATADREEHIIRIIGDNGDDNARNELRLIVGCVNPER